MTRARIQWLRLGEGGRTAPPPGPVYSTVARFEVLAERWPGEAWSVVLNISPPADAEGLMLAEIRLLVPERTPAELLKHGSRFELFEGAKCVARGEVV